MNINLYRVTVGSVAYHYTSGEFDLSDGGANYIAVPLKRTDLTFDFEQTEVTLTIPADLEPFTLFKYSVPLIPFIVEIISYPNIVTIFKGNVMTAAFDGAKNIAQVKLGSTQVLEGSTCPVRTFSTTCSYELFSAECGLNAASYATGVLVSAITVDGSNISSGAFGAHGDHYYTGGYVEASSGETQYITQQLGNTLYLLGGIVTLPDSTSITIYPGCSKAISNCRDKFANDTHFGGFPFIPEKNIFQEAL